MTTDPEQLRPFGDSAQALIIARQAESIRAANEALDRLRARDCWWESYHATFQRLTLVVGDSHGEDNVVLGLLDCRHISGPNFWSGHPLRVTWHNQSTDVKEWIFTLEASSIGFKAVGGAFTWRACCNVLEDVRHWRPRGLEPMPNLSLEESVNQVTRLLRLFYGGRISYGSLMNEVENVLVRTPIVESTLDPTPGQAVPSS